MWFMSQFKKKKKGMWCKRQQAWRRRAQGSQDGNELIWQLLTGKRGSHRHSKGKRRKRQIRRRERHRAPACKAWWQDTTSEVLLQEISELNQQETPPAGPATATCHPRPWELRAPRGPHSRGGLRSSRQEPLWASREPPRMFRVINAQSTVWRKPNAQVTGSEGRWGLWRRSGKGWVLF